MGVRPSWILGWETPESVRASMGAAPSAAPDAIDWADEGAGAGLDVVVGEGIGIGEAEKMLGGKALRFRDRETRRESCEIRGESPDGCR